MRAGQGRKTTAGLFCLGVFVWALTTFPCVHLLDLYAYHHMIGIGLHPELVAPYYRTITLATLGCSLLGTLLAWFLTRRSTPENRFAVLWGILSGIVFAPVLWAVISPSFRRLSVYPLDFGNFLYAGLLAGAVSGEIRFRTLLGKSDVPLSVDHVRQNFYVAALMTWAVILKVFGCFELVTIPAGRPVFESGAHLVRVLSVALWVPAVCRYLWKHPHRPAISMILFACAAGVLMPVAIACILYFPVLILVYAGLPPVAAAALWGIAFVNAPGIWRLVLLLAPGVTWGIIVGLLGRHYGQLTEDSKILTS